MSKVPVLEIFGPTIQGEGAAIGMKTMFVRTAGCDYSCAWCDSAFTWDGSAKDQIRMLTPQQIVDELDSIAANNYSMVTISGGNPALISEPMEELTGLLRDRQIKIAVETQGTRWQKWFNMVNILTISPKPPSSGMDTDWGQLEHILTHTKDPLISLKVVVFNDEDFLYAKQLHLKFPEIPFYVQVGNDNVTEAGDISARLLQGLEWLFQKVIDDPEMNEARVLPQLHALIWHNKRGK